MIRLGVKRTMRSRERYEQVERLVTMLANEPARRVSQSIGHIAGLLGRTPVFLQHAVRMRLSGVGEIAASTLQATEKPVETPLVRMKRSRITQVPLADQARGVTSRSQPLRTEHLGQRKPGFHVTWRDVVVVAELLLIPTGHQTRPRRRTDRSGHVRRR